jgi:predicted TIM-barrel fold metal-dependent hydrolase
METGHARPAIDVHAHFGPTAAQEVTQIMAANHLTHVVNLGTLERLGVPVAEGLAALRDVLGSRMIYFATPDFGDVSPGFGKRMADDLARKVALGAGGLKIFKELGLRHRDTSGQLIPVDDPRLDPLWARAGELDVPVLIHTGDPVAFFQPLDQHNERREELRRHPDWHFGKPGFPGHDQLLAQRNHMLERHPRTRFIGAHLGGYPEKLDYVAGCLDRYANFYVDTCARIGEIGRHPAAEARAFFVKYQDRILFGTDLVLRARETGERDVDLHTSFYDAHWVFFETDARQIEYPGYPIQGRWQVDGIDLPDDVLDKLYVQNARRLVPALNS